MSYLVKQLFQQNSIERVLPSIPYSTQPYCSEAPGELCYNEYKENK